MIINKKHPALVGTRGFRTILGQYATGTSQPSPVRKGFWKTFSADGTFTYPAVAEKYECTVTGKTVTICNIATKMIPQLDGHEYVFATIDISARNQLIPFVESPSPGDD